MAARINIDINHIVDAYQSGASVNCLAKQFGVSRQVIGRRLREVGITPRTRKEAELLKWAQMSPEQRKRQVMAAHQASKGRVDTEEVQVQRAQTRYRCGHGVSSNELEIAQLLRQKGFDPVHQFPVGRYNLDLALPVLAVAMEVHGGNWHAYGRHAARRQRRLEYLLDRGWHVVEVWICGQGPLVPNRLAEYLVTFLDQVRRDPATAGRHQMILGTGEPVPPGRSYGHNGPAIPHSLRRDELTGQYRSVG